VDTSNVSADSFPFLIGRIRTPSHQRIVERYGRFPFLIGRIRTCTLLKK